MSHRKISLLFSSTLASLRSGTNKYGTVAAHRRICKVQLPESRFLSGIDCAT